jgi:hypothetical protein
MMDARACGACSLCCKLLEIGETDKPADQWCPHCRPGKGGCSIYDHRPSTCREFLCQWLIDDSFGPEWQPLRCRMVLQVRRMQMFAGHYGLSVNVDQSRPQIWREPVYFQQLKAIASQMPVIVAVGARFFRIFSTGAIEEQEPMSAEEIERQRNEYRARYKAAERRGQATGGAD